MKLFITVDGHDGAGKTTAVKGLTEHIKKRIPAATVRTHKFPSEYPPHDATNEQKVEHFFEEFRSYFRQLRKLEPLDITVFDRSFLSTAMYQGYDLSMASTPRRPVLWHIMELGWKLFSAHCDSMLMVDLKCRPIVAWRREQSRTNETTDDEMGVKDKTEFLKYVGRLHSARVDMRRFMHNNASLGSPYHQGHPFVTCLTEDKQPDEVVKEIYGHVCVALVENLELKIQDFLG